MEFGRYSSTLRGVGTMWTKFCQIQGMKMIFHRNYGVELDLVDWYSLVDSTLTYPENYSIIHKELMKRQLLLKKPTTP